MAQPSGQLALKAAHSSEYFWYAQGTGIFDAKNNAMLTKTGSAGMSTESGVNVALGNSSTTYALGSAINLSSPWTLIVSCRVGASAGTQAMICGDTTGTGNYVWLRQDNGSVICKINGTGAGKTSTVTALATWAFVFSGGTLTTYKDGTSLGTETIPDANLKINTLLGGYSGGSFVFNGAFECANVIPSALSAGDISTRTADLYAVLEAGATDATAPGATLAGTSSLSVGSATGGAVVDGTATGTTLAGTSSLSAGTASGGTSGSFTTDAMENNTGAGLLANTAVAWTWYQGSIGAAPTSTSHGTGTTNASGVLTVSGLPTGAGFLLVSTTDSSGVYYQPGTVT